MASSGELAFGRELRRDKRISDHIPFVRHVTDSIIRLKGGEIMAVLQLDGAYFETADQAIVNSWHSARDKLWQGLSSRYAVYGHIVRRRVAPVIAGEFDEPFAEELDRRYMASISDVRLFQNEIFITIVRRPFLRGNIGLVDRMFGALGVTSGGEEPQTEMIRDLEEKCAEVAKMLGAYGARPLKIAVRENKPFSEPCEFASRLLNGGRHHQVAVARSPLDTYLPSHRIFFGRNSLEFRAPDGSRRYGAMVSVKEYPAATGPGLLNAFLRMPHELILTQSFQPMDRRAAQTRMARYTRQTAKSDDAAQATAASLASAADRLADNAVTFGDGHLSILMLSDELEGVRRGVGDAVAALNGLGMIGVREDLNTEAAFWAQLPGNFSYIARSAMMDTANFAGFFSGHNLPVGREKGGHWGGPISLLMSSADTPYWFQFHRGDFGNFSVVGPSGSGKTALLNFLLAQSLRVRPKPRCIFVDKDRSAAITIKALGGRFEELKPNKPTGFNPFGLPDTRANREFLKEFAAILLRPATGDLSQTERSVIAEAVDHLFENAAHNRTLKAFRELLGGQLKGGLEGLGARLAPWIDEKADGWLFNNPVDLLDWSQTNVVGFDMTEILDAPRLRTAALFYIFHRIEEVLDGAPTLIFLDEAWKLLDDRVFEYFIKDTMKTIRKKNGIIGIGTQEAEDMGKSAISSTLVQQTTLNIFLPNPKADDDVYRGLFGLSVKEMAVIKTTPVQTRQFLVREGVGSAVVRLDLNGAADLLKVLSGRPETVEEMERLIAVHGDDPAAWLPIFCGWDAANA